MMCDLTSLTSNILHHKCKFPPPIIGFNTRSTPAHPSSQFRALMSFVGGRGPRRDNMTNAPGTKERETPHLHPKP